MILVLKIKYENVETEIEKYKTSFVENAAMHNMRMFFFFIF
jgi:hypothetical protein